MNIDHSNNFPINTQFIPGNLYQSPGGNLFLMTRIVKPSPMLVNVYNGSTLQTFDYQRYIDVTDSYTLRRNK